MKTKLKVKHWILISLAILVASLTIVVSVTSQGPDRDYFIDVTLPKSTSVFSQAGTLEVGVGVRDITPDLKQYDTWVDKDGNAQFDPDIDTYEDRNKNGTFDFVWMAGFNEKRPAQGVNDPLWSRALAFKNHGTTVVLVSIDSIGMTYDQYIPIRERLAKSHPEITHVTFASTHTHQAPDTIGLWSYNPLFDYRFDHAYVDFIQEEIYQSVVEAVKTLEPAETVLAEAYVPMENFSHDSRPPVVVDHHLPLAWFKKKSDGQTIATLASWGMHPEGFGDTFLKLSSDFVHYFREAMEKGLTGPSAFEGFGGKSVFFTGPVGGLMTQLDIPITDRFGKVHKSFLTKSQAQGENLAILAAQALRDQPDAKRSVMKDQRLAVSAKTHYVAVGNPLKYVVMLGIVHPGVYDLPFETNIRTEISALRIGEMEILTTPGEIYPEIVDGGIDTPKGQDIKTGPVEIPPLRSVMKGTLNFNFNLGMDEIGYFVPTSQWDREEPYTYDYKEAPYGEVYVGTPVTAPKVHTLSIEHLKALHSHLGVK